MSLVPLLMNLVWPAAYVLGPIVALTIAWICVCRNNRTAGEFKIKADYFRVPVTHVLAMANFSIPALIAVAVYLYTTGSTRSVNFLELAIAFMVWIVVVALWLSLSIFQKGTSADIIDLKYPDDRKFLTAQSSLFFSFVGFLGSLLAFTIFEMAPYSPPVQASTDAGIHFVSKPDLKIGMTVDAVRKSWGSPHRTTGTGFEFMTINSIISVRFKSERLSEFREVAK